MSITDELRRWEVNIHPRLSPEDVLHNFICDIEEVVRDEREIIAEYAAKLRLADDRKG